MKYRANALNAILENWSTYENMLQQYADGDGSMAEEADFCLIIQKYVTKTHLIAGSA